MKRLHGFRHNVDILGNNDKGLLCNQDINFEGEGRKLLTTAEL